MKIAFLWRLATAWTKADLQNGAVKHAYHLPGRSFVHNGAAMHVYDLLGKSFVQYCSAMHAYHLLGESSLHALC